MAGGLVGRAKRLQARRGVDRGGGARRELGLIWISQEGEEIFPEDLDDDQYLVRDVTVTEHGEGDVSFGVARDRVSNDPDACGAVRAWDGSTIGTCKVPRKGATVLDYTWPVGLPVKRAGA